MGKFFRVIVALVFLTIVVVGIGHAAHILPSSDPFVVGQCVATMGTHVDGVVDCTEQHQGTIVGTTAHKYDCPFSADQYFIEKQSDVNPGRIVCVNSSG